MCLAQRGFLYEITFLVKSLMTHSFVVPGDWVVRYGMHVSVTHRRGERDQKQSPRDVTGSVIAPYVLERLGKRHC